MNKRTAARAILVVAWFAREDQWTKIVKWAREELKQGKED